MKLLALALVLLLAVGSQATPLQADAPTQLQQVRSAVGVYVQQVRDSAHRALDQLDDTEYSAYKAQLKLSLDNVQAQLTGLQTSASPYTDAIFGQIMESTEALRGSLLADVEAVKHELALSNLREIIERHGGDYSSRLEPVMREYSNMHKAEMESLKAKLEPILADLRAKFSTNVDETKAAVMPIVESVRTKLNERLEELKTMASPYVEEYKDQLKLVYQQARERASLLNAEEIQAQVTSLKEQTGPIAADFRAKIASVYELLMASINKQ
ncbi:apolipoprotein A-I-like [Genypterus blacodes]|uniref:apolipoprotein A-I-like n=1 Tax=Genypterus blacodes TaxID=154954 RepID=UPI003F76FBC7